MLTLEPVYMLLGAFLLFAASYGPILCTARKKKKAEAAA